MKRMVIITTALLLLAGTVIAQPGRKMWTGSGSDSLRGWGRSQMRLNLTDDQQKKLSDLCDNHFAEMETIRKQLIEKQDALYTLKTAETLDAKAIDKMIGEVGAINTEMDRKQEVHRQALRGILTREQLVLFDQCPRGRGYGMYSRGGTRSYGRGMSGGRGLRSYGRGMPGGRGMRSFGRGMRSYSRGMRSFGGGRGYGAWGAEPVPQPE